MALFNDRSIDDHQILSISYEGAAPATQVDLWVHDLTIGTLALDWDLSPDSHHLSRWYTELSREPFDHGKSIFISNNALLLRSSLHKKYWEWLEDVLSRNKDMLTSAKIYDAATRTNRRSVYFSMGLTGGLSIDGIFYDEVVSSGRELIGVDKKDVPLLPPSCKYLFLAYHKIYCASETSNVIMHDWVKFWFKEEPRYKQPLARVLKKRLGEPRTSNNPTGFIGEKKPRSKDTEKVFDNLGVKKDVKEETNLATLLSCWLCVFVLPNKEVDQIRPGVFKVASMMAQGKRFSLAVPVIASIYHGLREITSSHNPSTCGTAFPIHYVYGWLDRYYDSYFLSASTKFDCVARMIALTDLQDNFDFVKTFRKVKRRPLNRHFGGNIPIYKLACEKPKSPLATPKGNNVITFRTTKSKLATKVTPPSSKSKEKEVIKAVTKESKKAAVVNPKTPLSISASKPKPIVSQTSKPTGENKKRTTLVLSEGSSSDKPPMLGRVAPSTVTTFDRGSMINRGRLLAAKIYDSNIKSILGKTPFEKLTSLRPKLQVIYTEFSKLELDYSSLQTQAKERRLADVDTKRDQLIEELDQLDLEAKKLRESLEGIDAQRAQKQHGVSTLQEEQTIIEVTEVMELADMEVANNLEQLLKSELEEIQNLVWLD
ncbi:hypothetical protein RHSIM_Rhsim08G0107300 [Rhododendron simsii]|uniref:Aminotransferase-like plant mobile domain-containing protein n=1 Tax=Rhododendron simsii TaxID=118357 RepID=A0A834LJQ2_RHOSS|nr:hypothetical protein RHSIM_Rhsim08G0107300 [Rhododendron simsii]